MLVILPDEGSFGQVEGRLGAALLDEVRGNLLETQIELTMPRFGFETDLKLIDLLEGLGLRLPFDPYEADLSGVTKRHERRAARHLRGVAQGHDHRRREGHGAAAAATAILDMPVSGGGGPETMTLDRPFIFAIQERETGEILFLGRVTDPS